MLPQETSYVATGETVCCHRRQVMLPQEKLYVATGEMNKIQSLTYNWVSSLYLLSRMHIDVDVI